MADTAERRCADHAAMRRQAAWRWLEAPLMVGLSLWMALPAFQWCSANLSACRAAMGLPCEPAAECGSTASCPLDECPVAPGPTESRVWCVGPTADGVAPKEIPAPFSDADWMFDVVALAEALHPPPSRLERLDARSGLCPGLIAPHAPPLTRAPPLASLHLAKHARHDSRVAA